MTDFAPPHSAARRRVEWAVLAVAFLVWGGGLAAFLYSDLLDGRQREAERLASLVHVIEENLLRQLEGANAAIEGVRDEYLKSTTGDAQIPADLLSRRMGLLTASMPGVRTMVIVGPTGRIVASNRAELVGQDRARSDYYLQGSQRPEAATLFISKPFKATGGDWVITIARVVPGQGSSFGGMVTASMDPEYFEVLLRSSLYAPDMHAVLIHFNGQVFLTMPVTPTLLGKDVRAQGLLFDEHLRASGGTSTFIGRSLRGEGKQLMVMRTVSRDKLHIDAPIVLAVNRALFAVDGPWRLRAWELGGFYAFCLAASCVALRTRQNRRELLARAEASAASARAEGVRRLQLVADLLPSLVAYLDTDQRFLFANHAYREWLRVDPAALIGKSLAELFGDAAYQTFRMQIEAALAGERQVCEREMQTPGGSRYAEITAVPQLDPFGRVEGLCVLIHDLTERRRIELEQKRSEERLSLAIEGSNLGLFDWDLTSNEIFLSARAQEMLGGEAVPSKLTAARAQRLIHPEDIAAVRHMARGVVEGSASNFNAEYRVHHRSGSWLWVRSRGRVFERDAHGKALRLAGTHFEIGERKAREERLRQLAETDALTGLPNRALFQDRLRHALDRAVRSGRILALLFVDIDHFKQVNDMAGHAAGDQVLMAFSARLTEAVRKSDTVARLGGDEFTVILEELGQREDARVVAEKLVVSARLPIPLSDRVVHVSASVGIAFFQGAAESEHQLMGRADAALYEAKARGRNGWVAAGEHEGSPPG